MILANFPQNLIKNLTLLCGGLRQIGVKEKSEGVGQKEIGQILKILDHFSPGDDLLNPNKQFRYLELT